MLDRLLDFRTFANLIEVAGSLVLIGYVVAALFMLLRGHVTQARLLVAEGAVTALSFKTAATLLKTIELHTWNQIGLFVVTLALRTLLKRVFSWEARQLRRADHPLP